jgi:hypothetical protein
MRISEIAVLGTALLLCGCAASADPPPDPPVWGRVDCQRSEGNPALVQEFDLAKQICSSQAEAAALSGTANMPRGYGLAGGIAASINQGTTAGNISRATGNGCMGEHGYMLRTRSEHIEACEAIQAQRQAAAPPPQKRVAPAKPRPAPPPVALEAPKPTT